MYIYDLNMHTLKIYTFFSVCVCLCVRVCVGVCVCACALKYENIYFMIIYTLLFGMHTPWKCNLQ